MNDDAQKGLELLEQLEARLSLQDLTTHVWPCVIVPARYSGVYEGGDWLAFNCTLAEMPAAAFGDDVACSVWWDEHEQGTVGLPGPRPLYVGKGSTPGLALANLARQLP